MELLRSRRGSELLEAAIALKDLSALPGNASKPYVSDYDAIVETMNRYNEDVRTGASARNAARDVSVDAHLRAARHDDTLHHADPAKLDRMATVYRGGLAERRSSSPGARRISTALAVR